MGSGGPGSSPPPFCPGIFFFCKRVSYGTSSVFSLINIVNKKRICVRSLHFKSQMTKAPRIHAVNIRLKQTGFDNVSGRQCCCLCRKVVCVPSPQSLRPLLASQSVNYFFDHNHTCGLLNISALHVQYGIQAFVKFKRPECTRLHLRELQSQNISQSCIRAQIPLPEVQSNPVSR